MPEHKSEQTADLGHHPLPVARDVGEQTGTRSAPSVQRDPVDQVACRAGDMSCASAHASTINRSTASKPARAEHSLLQLQKQYGNRYVKSVLAAAKENT